MIRKFQVVRVTLASGREGLFLGLAGEYADGRGDAAEGRMEEAIASSMILECDDRISLRDLWLLSEFDGRLQ